MCAKKSSEEDLADLIERKAEEAEHRVVEEELKIKKERAEEEIKRKLGAEKQAKRQARSEKISKALDVTKKVGKIGGKGMVAAAAAGAGLMTGLAAKSREKSSSGISLGAKFLFWFSVFVHGFLMVLIGRNVARVTYLYAACILIVATLAWAFIVFHNEGTFSRSTIIGFVIIFSYYFVIPLVLSLNLFQNINITGSINLPQLFFILVVVIPILPLFVGSHTGISTASKWVSIVIFILLIAFFLLFFVELSPERIVSMTGTTQLEGIGGGFAYLVEEVGKAAKTFWNKLNPSRVISQIRNATGLNYYTGMIDNNEKAPVGLYLENVRLADKYIYEGYPAIIWADIRGKSFVDEINVEPSCYIDKIGPGERDPNHFSIYGEEHGTLSCTFYNLTKGSYLARVSATFNFETWAYVTYTFIDIETKRALELQGKNVNYELDVEPLPRAVYTNGPVMLGMASMVDQPIGIDTQYNTREPILGVTLDNLWTDGEIERVEEFIIMVPDDFELVKCDRWRPDTKRPPTRSEEGHDFYSFSREEIGDPRLTFQSVTCRLHIKSPNELLAGAQKVQRTFVAQAKYRYKLEKSVRIYVRE